MAAQNRLARAVAELTGYFGPESLTWRIGRESVMILGGGRAVLMQLAHPLVAAGVGQHSGYARDPWGRTTATLELTQRIAFGTRAEANEAARFINHLHLGVSGTLEQDAGAFAPGTPYQARQHDLLLWVHTTLVDTALLLYPQLVTPLTRAEQERYYEESKVAVTLLGLPYEAIPATLDAFKAYVSAMLDSNELAVTPEALAVARVVLRMPAPLVVRPLLAVGTQATIGWLPDRLRRQYGYSWDAGRQRLLEAATMGIRHLLPATPLLLRETFWARAAERRVRHLRNLMDKPA
jgi:uncharacterized protein (DUF2236 family)